MTDKPSTRITAMNASDEMLEMSVIAGIIEIAQKSSARSMKRYQWAEHVLGFILMKSGMSQITIHKEEFIQFQNNFPAVRVDSNPVTGSITIQILSVADLMAVEKQQGNKQ